MNTLKRLFLGIIASAAAIVACFAQQVNQPTAPKSPVSAADQQGDAKDLTAKRGQYQVDLFTGAFTYSVPIICPPARNGSEPALALTYTSGAENGWCGVGWKLDIGFIERNTKEGFPIQYDTTTNPHTPINAYDNSKGFILNLFGKEYKLLFANGTEYRPEIDDDHLRCFFDASNNKWKVYDKSGTIYYFGEYYNATSPNTDSKANVVNNKNGWPAGAASTFHWGLDQIDTATGDRTLITYETDNSPEGLAEKMIYPKEIVYNGHAAVDSYSQVYAGQHKISFIRETGTTVRPDRRFSYRWGFRTEQNRRLLSIVTTVGTKNVSRYDLNYVDGANGLSKGTKRSLLRSVTPYGADNANNWLALQTQKFTYQEPVDPLKPIVYGDPIQWQNMTVLRPDGSLQDPFITGTDNNVSGGVVAAISDLVDIDGDGLPDRVSYDATTTVPASKRKYQVQRNLGVQTSGPSVGQGLFGARFAFNYTSTGNGDEFSLPTSGNPIPGNDFWSALNSQAVRLRDIDGDGLPDRICDDWRRWQNGTYDVTKVYDRFTVMLNKGGAFSTTTTDWLTVDPGPSAAGTDGIYYGTIESGGVNTAFFDINGDGLPDRVMTIYFSEQGSSTLMTYYRVQFNTGSGFTPPKLFGPYQSQDHHTGGVKSDSPPYPPYYWTGLETPEVHMIDINGDGLPDRLMYPIGSVRGNELPHPTSYYAVEYNNGYGFEAVNTSTSDPTASPFMPRLADRWDGVVSQSTAAGTAAITYDAMINQQVDGTTGYENQYVGLYDMNGDGLPDRVMLDETTTLTPTAANSYRKWKVYLNLGTKFDTTAISVDHIYDQGQPSTTTTPSIRSWWCMQSLYYGAKQVALMDVNGDQLLDRVMMVKGNNGSANYFIVQLNASPVPDLLSGTDNGIGGITTISYKSSTAFNNQSDPSVANSGSLLPFPVQVVEKVTENDGVNSARTVTYSYEGGFYSGKRREFEGFAKVTAQDPPSTSAGRKKTYFFHQGGGREFPGMGEYLDKAADAGSFAKKGLAFRVETYGNEPTPVLYNVVVNQVDVFAGGASGSYFPYVKQTFVYDYIAAASKVTATAYTVDSVTGNRLKKSMYGQVTGTDLTTFAMGTDVNTVDNVFEHTSYATIAGGASYVVDRPDTVKTTSDATGNTILQQTKYTYNAAQATPNVLNSHPAGTLASVQHLICGDPNAVPSDAQYATTLYGTYDLYGMPTITTDPVGVETKVDYDGTYHIFKTSGRIRATAGVDSTTGGDYVTSATYDERSGAVLGATDAMGVSIRNVYDQFYRLTETYKTPYLGTEFWTKKIDYALTAIGSVVAGKPESFTHVRAQDGTADPNGTETWTYFDGFGRPIETRTEAENDLTDTTTLANGVVTGLTARNYRVISTAYDERGKAFLSTWPSLEAGYGFTFPTTGKPATVTEFDENGRVKKIIRRANVTFNSLGAFVSKVDSTGDTTSLLSAKQWTYGKTGDPWWINFTDEDGKKRNFGLDAFGRTNSIEEIDRTSTYTSTLSYDLLSRLTDITDSRVGAASTIHYGYDALGNTVAMADPHLGLWTYRWDAAGRIREQADARGDVVKFFYADSVNKQDPLGRLLRKEVYTSAALSVGVPTSTATYIYDTGDSQHTVYKGLPFLLTDSEGWTKHGYDSRGREIKTTRHLNINNKDYVTTYTYDDADHVISIVYPQSGPTIKYAYHSAGSISRVYRTTAGVDYNFYAADVTLNGNPNYDDLGHVLNVAYGNGTMTTRGYYSLSKRLQSIGVSSGTSTLFTRSYEYAASDDVKKISGSGLSTAQTLVYDNLHRLTSFDNGATSYSYDRLGNIIHNIEVASLDYTYASPRIQAVRTAFGKNYLYDQCGNMVVRGSDANGAQSLSYDAENRLVRLLQVDSTPANALMVEYGYAADGSRLWKRPNQDNTKLQVWIGNIYEEKVASDGTRKTLFHVFAGGQLVCTFEPTSVLNGGANASTPATTFVGYYYQQDHLGSSSALTGSDGSVVEMNAWYPFGRTLSGAPQANFKVSNQFTGQVQDQETGLYYFGGRYYAPELGRFIQPDTIISDLGNPQSYNRYSYCLNNPLRYVDPNGHEPEEWANFNQPYIDSYFGSYLSDPSHTSTIGLFAVYMGEGFANGINDTLRLGTGAAEGGLNGWGADLQRAGSLILIVTGGGGRGRSGANTAAETPKTPSEAPAPAPAPEASPAPARPAPEPAAQGVDLKLKYKEGWTEEQRGAARQKVDALNKVEKVVTKNPERSGTAQARYRKEAGLDKTMDADHTHDLQLGGKDTMENMSGLDRSVNRSLGPQIQHKINKLPPGTRINKITIE